MVVLLMLPACQASTPERATPTAGSAVLTATPPAAHTHTSGPPTEVGRTESPALPTETVEPAAAAAGTLVVPGARSINVVAGAGEVVYVLAGVGHDLELYASADAGRSFGPAVSVSQGPHAEVL